MAVYRDFKLNAQGDLDLTGGDINVVDDVQAIIQLVSNRLQFWQGEWFLDRRQGMPILNQILVKNPNLALIKAVYRQAIATTPGILRVISVELAFDTTKRKLTVTWQAQASTGATLPSTSNDFIFPATTADPTRAP